MDESDYFWRLVNTPLYWQDAARDFICGANLLKRDYYSKPRLGFARRRSLSAYAATRQRHTSARTIIVLYALATENLLKAIIVALGKDPIDSHGELHRWFASHDLEKLATHAGLQGLDLKLLRQLADFIKAGKYPVGLRDRQGHSAHSYFPDSVIVGIEKLLPVLEERLHQVPAKREKLPKTDLLKLCAGLKRVSSREP
jgi:hypothetical protein